MSDANKEELAAKNVKFENEKLFSLFLKDDEMKCLPKQYQRRYYKLYCTSNKKII
jgi:hypothetical protein